MAQKEGRRDRMACAHSTEYTTHINSFQVINDTSHVLLQHTLTQHIPTQS